MTKSNNHFQYEELDPKIQDKLSHINVIFDKTTIMQQNGNLKSYRFNLFKNNK